MDQLTRHPLNEKIKEFIDSIKPALICELASSLHPKKKPLPDLLGPKKGSYNIRFPVVFTDQILTVESIQSAER
ncbi:hypothetical protein AJ78_03096 [Emergomyces pasteurianus Ep9510]|uniref:Uncharacterized protein n=1 Tax=Emergomyces pasteurianus Ep9510 TaxID=1447872 RepID=A0A1J9PKZ4_9EURO|nr:hypothetical protein AJ78_03096 [Emergomyces pasteurianus Ep9510]